MAFTRYSTDVLRGPLILVVGLLQNENDFYCGCWLKVVKYWPEIGKCGYLVWRYLLRRDDQEPAPWTPEGLERIKKLGLVVQVGHGRYCSVRG